MDSWQLAHKSTAGMPSPTMDEKLACLDPKSKSPSACESAKLPETLKAEVRMPADDLLASHSDSPSEHILEDGGSNFESHKRRRIAECEPDCSGEKVDAHACQSAPWNASEVLLFSGP
jgi:hypothetical protein